jgi:hypothetical protein
MKKNLFVVLSLILITGNTAARAEETKEPEKKFNAAVSLGYPRGIGLQLNYRTGHKTMLGTSLSSSYYFSDFSLYRRFYLYNLGSFENGDLRLYSQTGAHLSMVLGWVLSWGLGVSQAIGLEYKTPEGFNFNFSGGVGAGYPIYSSWPAASAYNLFVTPDINLSAGMDF